MIQLNKKILNERFNSYLKSLIYLYIIISTLVLLSILQYKLGFFGGRVEFFSVNQNGKISILLAQNISVIIFIMILAYNNFYEYFAISNSMGLTRRNFFKYSMISNILAIGVISLIGSASIKFEPLLIRSLGLNPIYNFYIFNIKTDSLLYIMMISFLILMLSFSIIYFVAGLNYKYGAKIWFLFISLIIIIFNSENIISLNLIKFANILSSRFTINSYIYILTSTLSLIALTYILVIKTDIKEEKN